MTFVALDETDLETDAVPISHGRSFCSCYLSPMQNNGGVMGRMGGMMHGRMMRGGYGGDTTPNSR